MFEITINGNKIKAEEEATILEAARENDIYIPTLCYHPDLTSSRGMKPAEYVDRAEGRIRNALNGPKDFQGCRLCLVEIEMQEELTTACNTMVQNGMAIHTRNERITKARQENLIPLLLNHPHSCLVCPQQGGCPRTQCSANVPEVERCCPKLGNCELQKVANFIGVPLNLPKYVPRGFAVFDQEPLFNRDYNLCIGCLRCVRACKELRGIGAIDFTFNDYGEAIVGGAKAASMRESDCKFCTTCVEVCPTGAISDKQELKTATREEVLVPCRAACPAGIHVPRYLRYVAKEKYMEATAVIREKVPIPETLGKICFHPCEDVCRRGEVNEPISICALKGFAAKRDSGLWKERIPNPQPTGKKVAIVGSGPAGLTAGYFLARKGHRVTVFESMPEPGGMMRYGIPEYRLPLETLQREIEDICAQGVEIRTNTPIGNSLGIEELQQQFDVLFLAAGAPLSKKIQLPGIDLPEVVWGMDFLRDLRSGKEVKVKDRVLVIGGGNVAIDVALSTFRVGAREVQLACLESREEMPAHEWEITEALEEGVRINPSFGLNKILGDSKVNGVELVRCTRVFNDEGKFDPQFDTSETVVLETDMILIAIGQTPDHSYLRNNKLVKIKGGLIDADPRSQMTSEERIFAGGEVASGPGSVIQAIAAGRRAAVSIDQFLGGDGNIEESFIKDDFPNPWLGKEDGFADKPRAARSCMPVEKRHEGFTDVAQDLPEKEALKEAKRCLQCDLRLCISEVPLPPEKWLAFNAENVAKVPDTEGIFQLLDENKEVIAIKGTMNMQQDLKGKLEAGTKARFFTFEEDKMYSKRESELIQQFLQKYGRMPQGGDEELDNLF